MAITFPDTSHTFGEHLLIPGLTTLECTVDKISLRTPLAKYSPVKEESCISLNIPFVSIIMQSVSNDTMAIALARNGGLSFIFGSQPIEKEAEMVVRVKKSKAGFVRGDANISPKDILADVLAITQNTGHSTIGVTDDGTPDGVLCGIVTSRDYHLSTDSMDRKVADFMTPFERLTTGRKGISLSEANDIIWSHKLNALPIIDENRRPCYFVFREDCDSHKENPLELQNPHNKTPMAGADINIRSYKERVPALVEAEADVLYIDSSDGFSVWQKEIITWIREQYGDRVIVGADNVVDQDGFRYLVEAGADSIKVGIGGDSICTTREQKGIERGQATAVIDVAKARDDYYRETGICMPIYSDGDIVYNYHMTLAPTMGADFLMMGRCLARFDESPTEKLHIGNNIVKEYWGEGSNRAHNWQRYDGGGAATVMKFEEGVDSYVPYAGPMKDVLDQTFSKIKATMSSCGMVDLKTLRENTKLTFVSSTLIIEGGAHDVIRKNRT